MCDASDCNKCTQKSPTGQQNMICLSFKKFATRHLLEPGAYTFIFNLVLLRTKYSGTTYILSMFRDQIEQHIEHNTTAKMQEFCSRHKFTEDPILRPYVRAMVCPL